MTRATLGLAFILLAGAALRAQDEDDVFARRPAGSDKAREHFKADQKAHAGNPDVLVLPGLTADRKRRTVEVLAECTGLGDGEPVEFLLVDQGSGHGYEALLWSFAKPSDVHRALEFIGLKPGAPRNPALPHLGSDGDRVRLTVRPEKGEAFPAERLVLDKETEQTLPEDGFVFAGSILAPPPEGQGSRQYVADLYDPRAVAPLFNDPAAVLDLPRLAEQGEVYDRQVVNPAHVFEKGRLLTVVMAPDERPGRPVARRLQLAAEHAAGTTGTVFCLRGANDAILVEGAQLTPVLERLAALNKEDQAAPRVGLSFGGAMPIPDVVKICALMATMESLGVVRVDPPEDGHPYYRAFLPDKAWRTPRGRPSKPWELHLRLRDATVAGELIWNDPDGGSGSRKTADAPTPGSLRSVLEADARERAKAGRPALPAVLLVFAGPGLSYGQVCRFLAPVLSTHGTVYVFDESPGEPSKRAERREASMGKETK